MATDLVDALVTVLTSVQGILVTISLVSMLTAFGMQLTRGDVRRTTREYNLVARWILANLLAVPLFAALLGAVIGLPDSILVALLLVAVAPGAPFIPQLATMAGGNSHEAIRLTAALTVVATVTVPLLVFVTLELLQVGIGVSLVRLLLPLLLALVVPLVAGAALRDRRPDLAAPATRGLIALSNVTLLLALVLVVLLNPGTARRALAILYGTGALLLMALFVLASIAIGWLTGGPTPQNRRILALGTAARNVNIALFIATVAFPDSTAEDSIVAFAFIMFAVSLLVAWYWRHHPLTEESTQGSESPKRQSPES